MFTERMIAAKYILWGLHLFGTLFFLWGSWMMYLGMGDGISPEEGIRMMSITALASMSVIFLAVTFFKRISIFVKWVALGAYMPLSVFLVSFGVLSILKEASLMIGLTVNLLEAAFIYLLLFEMKNVNQPEQDNPITRL